MPVSVDLQIHLDELPILAAKQADSDNVSIKPAGFCGQVSRKHRENHPSNIPPKCRIGLPVVHYQIGIHPDRMLPDAKRGGSAGIVDELAASMGTR